MNIPFIDGLPMKNGDFPVRYPGQELVEELAADHEETALGRLTGTEGHVLLRQGANAQRHAGEPPGEVRG